MPQNALAATVSVTPAGQQAPQYLDSYQNINVVASPSKTVLNISAAAVVKAAPGLIGRVNVITAGSAAGTVNDCLTTGAAATANAVATIPNTVGSYPIEMYTSTGIVVVPGSGQVLTISYD